MGALGDLVGTLYMALRGTCVFFGDYLPPCCPQEYLFCRGTIIWEAPSLEVLQTLFVGDYGHYDDIRHPLAPLWLGA